MSDDLTFALLVALETEIGVRLREINPDTDPELALDKLVRAGYVEHRPSGFYALTDAGFQAALSVLR